VIIGDLRRVRKRSFSCAADKTSFCGLSRRSQNGHVPGIECIGSLLTGCILFASIILILRAAWALLPKVRAGCVMWSPQLCGVGLLTPWHDWWQGQLNAT